MKRKNNYKRKDINSVFLYIGGGFVLILIFFGSGGEPGAAANFLFLNFKKFLLPLLPEAQPF